MDGTEKVGVYKRKDGNPEGRIPPPKPEMPEETSKQESTTTTRITAQGGSRGSVSHEVKHEAARTMDTITREGIDGETQSDHTEYYANSDRTLWTHMII